jgi:dinuclear metal center YbgI/SA1388 family protein
VSVKVKDIQEAIERWAPRSIAWERDNTGLQCGNPDMPVRGVLVCLDITEDIVRDALRRKSNLIISHHPLLFHPLSSVTPSTHIGRTVTTLVKKDIAALAVHTNLDAAPDGTSHALARTLGVEHPETLEPGERLQVKLTTFVPAADADRVASALGDAGAGVIGKYRHCSFRAEGTGTFLGDADAHPAVGHAGVLEHVPEVRLEMVVDRHIVPSVIGALLQSHPYEEPAYDLVPMENSHRTFGMGAIGDLSRPVSLAGFLRRVQTTLGAGALRYTGEPDKQIRRVAVCGGSGSNLISLAIARKADVFVTADVSFHRFQDAAGRIALVDAGHHETEFPVLTVLAGKVREACREHGAPTPVAVSAVRTNPIAYV